MGDVLKGSNDQEKLSQLSQRPYKAQAIWYLNAFWEQGANEKAEKVWQYVDKLARLDLQKGEEGNEVDEYNMHRFLEAFQETMTVKEMRDSLRAKGAIGEQFKHIALIHYLVYAYDLNFNELVNAPQGDNKEALEEAQHMLDEVSKALKESEAKAKLAKDALAKAKAEEAEAKSREAEAKSKEADAKAKEAEAKASAERARTAESDAKNSAEKARVSEEEAKVREAQTKVKEAESKAAQKELEIALAEVQKQESEFNARTEDLKRKSEEGSVVQQNKAKNELAQHLAGDPLPLRRAKITLEAAVKRAEKATKALADANLISQNATKEATNTRHAAEESHKQATQARASAEQAHNQASQARSVAEQAAEQASCARASAESSRAESEEATRQAEEAVRQMQLRFQEAEAFLVEVKSRPGKSHGAIWWLERQLHEKRKYMPVSKGGISK